MNKSKTMSCIFCGAGVTPMVINGMMDNWGCLACGSRRSGIVEVLASLGPESPGLATMYRVGNKTKLCPVGCLMIHEWKAL